MNGTELTNVPPMAPSAEMIAADLGPGGMGKRDFGASVGRILADRNTTPEERSRRMYMAPGKPSPRVGPPPPPLYDTPGSASGIEIKGGDPSYITSQDISKILGLTPPTRDPDKADFYAFKSTLRDPGFLGRVVLPGEDMSYEDFVKFGRPANLAAAAAAGYGGVISEEALKGGGLLPDSGVSGNLYGTAEAGGILGGTAAAGGLLPNVVKNPNPINYYMGRPTNMTTAAEIENFDAINNPNPMGEGPGALMLIMIFWIMA